MIQLLDGCCSLKYTLLAQIPNNIVDCVNPLKYSLNVYGNLAARCLLNITLGLVYLIKRGIYAYVVVVYYVTI